MNDECESAGERQIDVRWLLNPDEEPRQDIRLTICDDVLTDIRSCPAGRQPAPVAIVPPLVNVHTHLEFSSLTQPFAAGDSFPDWIRSVIGWRQSVDRDAATGSVRAGLRESARCGVAVVGDIATSDVLPDALSADSPHVVSFREVIGLNAADTDHHVSVVQAFLRLIRNCGGPGKLQPAISPHAPYSVHPETFAALVDLAKRDDVPVAMHLAETREERELLASGTGAFREFLTSMQLWDPAVFPGGRNVLFFLEKLAGLPRSLAIHGNYLDAAERQFLCEHPQVALVYCPRTHAHFGHAAHSWQTLKAAGATVLLATDSRASTPDLHLWREMQAAARQAPQISPSQLLRMITTDAARALGLNADDFRITVGKRFRHVMLDCRRSEATSAETLIRDEAVGPILSRS